MLNRTHLAIVGLFIILFIPLVNNPFLFTIVALVSGVLPDIDSRFSTSGKNLIGRFVQFISDHRGIFHSISFCIVIALLLCFIIPILAFAFFVGYALHIFADSFTKDGVPVFWPWPKKASGWISTGGVVEKGVFFIFIAFDLMLIWFYLL